MKVWKELGEDGQPVPRGPRPKPVFDDWAVVAFLSAYVWACAEADRTERVVTLPLFRKFRVSPSKLWRELD